MNQDSRYQLLREAGWRRPLTAAESDEMRNLLSAHPEFQADWESDQKLSRALNELRDVPVASNFTAQVLEVLDQEERQSGRARLGARLRIRWVPRFAFGLLVVVSSIAVVRHYQFEARQQLAKSIASLAEKPRPEADALLNFDAILLMSKASMPDVASAPDSELLSLLR